MRINVNMCDKDKDCIQKKGDGLYTKSVFHYSSLDVFVKFSRYSIKDLYFFNHLKYASWFTGLPMNSDS